MDIKQDIVIVIIQSQNMEVLSAMDKVNEHVDATLQDCYDCPISPPNIVVEHQGKLYKRKRIFYMFILFTCIRIEN